jgi:CrcB protein
MKTILLIGLGGGIGSIMRYLTSMLVAKQVSSVFPWATFVVNIIGCLVAGIILGVLERQQVLNSDLKFLLITGFCGGYTTFSAFSVENIQLLQSGHSLIALLYISISILLGVMAVWVGMTLIKTV